MTTRHRPSRHCLQRLRQYFPRLSVAQQRVAEHFLQFPNEALNSSVHEIASVCNTSPSTVVRLAKDIGFDGLKEMKLALAQEIGTLIPRIEQRTAQDPEEHAGELLENTLLGLQETAHGMNHAELDRCVAVLRDARHVDVYGAGSSYLVGMDLVEKLKRLGIYASTYENNYMQAISSAGLRNGDVAVAVTYSGETRSIIENLGMAQEQGAITVALTNFPDSTIIQIADIVIPTSVTRHLLPDGSLGGRIAQLFVVDLLFVKLFASDPERFREAYRRYNEILLNKVNKTRDRLGQGRSGAGTDEGDTGASNRISKLVGGDSE